MDIENIKKWIESLNITKLYLVLANVVLAIFAIWFSNIGLLPFAKLSDFAFFATLALILALYRPGWTFVFFVGALVLENINLAPKNLGLSLRPYQFFGLITIFSVLVQFFSKRLAFAFPKWSWQDALLVCFGVAGFLSALGAQNKAVSFKQSIVALSFIALYFLVRVYVQSLDDLKRIAPFLLSSGLVVAVYGIWQNVLFLQNKISFEVMPGRPNSTFTEPDWLGIYLVLLLAVVYTIIFALQKKSSVNSHQSTVMQGEKAGAMTDDKLLMTKIYIQQVLSYSFLILVFISLVLTVSRSAWVGAALATAGFLKFVLYGGSLNPSRWQWKRFVKQLAILVLLAGMGLGISTRLTRFQIFNRAVSTGGMQKITVACERELSPQSAGKDFSELEKLGCRHINLEDIAKEKAAGNFIAEALRPDPSLNIRADIYGKSIEQIRENPILGIGWGNITNILGKDENGAGLNASNIFLEVYLGSGLIGILSFIILLVWIFASAVKKYLKKEIVEVSAVFILLGWTAVVVPNMFNSGIFLGFVWTYLAVAVSLLLENKK